jgi:hypothetical protein
MTYPSPSHFFTNIHSNVQYLPGLVRLSLPHAGAVHVIQRLDPKPCTLHCCYTTIISVTVSTEIFTCLNKLVPPKPEKKTPVLFIVVMYNYQGPCKPGKYSRRPA